MDEAQRKERAELVARNEQLTHENRMLRGENKNLKELLNYIAGALGSVQSIVLHTKAEIESET